MIDDATDRASTPREPDIDENGVDRAQAEILRRLAALPVLEATLAESLKRG